MSGSKLQIAIVAGLVVSAGLVLQAAIPRLAKDTGLLYLRAQYKLATGDPDSALRLMQQAATSTSSQRRANATDPAPQNSECPYTHGTPSTGAKPGVVTPHVVSVRQITPTKAHVRRLAIQIPDYWSAQQMQIMAQLQAHQLEQQAYLRETLAKAHAQLRSLPVMVPVSVPTVIVPRIGAALP